MFLLGGSTVQRVLCWEVLLSSVFFVGRFYCPACGSTDLDIIPRRRLLISNDVVWILQSTTTHGIISCIVQL